MTASEQPQTAAGAAIYSPLALKLYDAWVLGFSNHYAWNCPTNRVLLPFFRRHLGRRHLDVGVGTGYYLAKAGFTADHQVSLLDLNGHSLQAAARRMGRPDCPRYQADVMAPLALPADQRFEAISLFYLLHCLPGTMADKAAVFAHLKVWLADGGTLYGATILGDSAGHNRIGARLMAVYNAKGIFGNRSDSLTSLRAALNRHFRRIEVQQVGKVALFTASRPKG